MVCGKYNNIGIKGEYMSRVEKPDLVEEKFKNQLKPDCLGTLKRCECEIGNLLEYGNLDPEWREIFQDLHNQVAASI